MSTEETMRFSVETHHLPQRVATCAPGRSKMGRDELARKLGEK